MKRVLEKTPVIKSNRQPKSLKQLLTRAKFIDQADSCQPKVTKCGHPTCATCDNLIEGESFEFKDGPKFRVKTNMTCSSSNLLYVIKCGGCGENYIGQTGMELRKRMTVHRQQIRDPSTRMIPLSGHISRCAKNSAKQFHVFPFYKFKDTACELERTVKEAEFISKYNPILNQ